MRKEYGRQQQYREVGDNSSQQGNCEDGVCTGSVEWWLHGEKQLWIPTSAAQNPWNYTLLSESSNDDNGAAGASSDSPIKKLSASNGWCDLRRFGLSGVSAHGEAASADKMDAANYVNNAFKTLSGEGGYKQVFNIDWTGFGTNAVSYLSHERRSHSPLDSRPMKNGWHYSCVGMRRDLWLSQALFIY